MAQIKEEGTEEAQFVKPTRVFEECFVLISDWETTE